MFSSNALLLKRLFTVLAVLCAVGCSTVRAPSPADPYEGFNRSVDAFNQRLDQIILKPVARGYVAAVPEFARTGVSNFFSNIGDVLTSVNILLQGKPKEAASDLGRFAVNTTIGVLGLFDVASEMGRTSTTKNSGKRWGVGG